MGDVLVQVSCMRGQVARSNDLNVKMQVNSMVEAFGGPREARSRSACLQGCRAASSTCMCHAQDPP